MPKLSRDMSKMENNRKLQLGHMCCSYLQILFHALQVLNVATTGITPQTDMRTHLKRAPACQGPPC